MLLDIRDISASVSPLKRPMCVCLPRQQSSYVIKPCSKACLFCIRGKERGQLVFLFKTRDIELDSSSFTTLLTSPQYYTGKK